MKNRYKKVILMAVFALAIALSFGQNVEKASAGTCVYNKLNEPGTASSVSVGSKEECDDLCPSAMESDLSSPRNCIYTADTSPNQAQQQDLLQNAVKQQDNAIINGYQPTNNSSNQPSSPTNQTNTPSGGSQTGSGGGNISFPPPTKYTTVGQMLSAVTVALKNLVVPVAIIFIVVGGLMYMMSAGNETMIKRARACITGAVIGLAIVLAGPTFLKEIQTISGVSISSELSQQLTIAQIAGRILSFLLSILGIVAIISLVIGGMTYLTAYGNDKRIQSAKTMIQYSIIGIVVALGALIIVRQVMSFF